MREHIEELTGVEVIADDFVIVGLRNTPAEWQADHDRNVSAFLDRCRERNLKLNKKKARLRQQEVPFIGHILTPEGLKPDPHKVEAIAGMPDPTDVPGHGELLVKVPPTSIRRNRSLEKTH